MQCYVYKGDRKEDHFVFLPQRLVQTAQSESTSTVSESRECDADFAEAQTALPDAVTRLLGELSFVLEFELTPDRTLSQADARQVIEDIQTQGFYLQMPKKDLQAEEDRLFG